jgi:hypothetical protein
VLLGAMPARNTQSLRRAETAAQLGQGIGLLLSAAKLAWNLQPRMECNALALSFAG